MPTPNGLVKYSSEPVVAVSFCFRSLMSTIPVTASPKIGSGESMLWPPASGIPASAQMLRAPSSTRRATSGGSLSTGQPSTAMASSGRPPMAYTSEMALAEAMRPKS